MTHTDLATSVFLQPAASIPLVCPSLRDIHLPTTPGSPAPTSEITPDIDRGTIAAAYCYYNHNLK